MSKNILLLVTGMTPQIITETVWALACDPNNQDQWIPDEIHVLSTQDGLTQIKSRLFADGVFKQFTADYPQLANIRFNDSSLHVIRNGENQALTDLKTPEDNEYAANAICEKVREYTADENVTLHVSIAGGRKTMGFYAGYALSLYGRAQDRMSHVLVEEKFETARDFFYPTPESYFVTDRFDKEWDAKDAQVWLAKIPFVRMKDAVKDKHQLKSDDSFSEVVHKINESFNDVKLVIDLAKEMIIVNGKFEIHDLPPREFAMLYWFADRRKQGLTGILAPNRSITSSDAKQNDLEIIGELTTAFKAYYAEVKSISDESNVSVDKKFFEGVKSHLKTALETFLGLELAEKIAIKQEGRGKPFYLDLQPENIEIIDSFKN
ncbi:MAG: CRISPR-associated ring nuclease Csm6 [Acinetobacter johnsonii]|uniref:CRISPR-associated ring nuclease Csm6 n=1 Tax=Acinetobacter johnsonii TaxID=40214 RepID=UPI002D80306B|nr:CRISPR-associated ring nuclease Csm6 [Acinetobacter johnsonii]